MRSIQETFSILAQYKLLSGAIIVKGLLILATALGVGDFGLSDERWKAIEQSIDGVVFLITILAVKHAHESDPYDPLVRR